MIALVLHSPRAFAANRTNGRVLADGLAMLQGLKTKIRMEILPFTIEHRAKMATSAKNSFMIAQKTEHDRLTSEAIVAKLFEGAGDVVFGGSKL